MTSQTASSSSSSKPDEWEFEVFLSFSGDTRNGFTDHLYTDLNWKGISTFRDDEEIETGFEISPELRHAIENSRMAVIVFSKGYASSTWCLDELVTIAECREERGLIVWPIFYHVDPSEVRNQTGTFADAFHTHEKRFKNDIEKVERWRVALREVANLSGKHLKDSRPEANFIQEIVENIFFELNDKISSNDSNVLVGIESRVEKMNSFLNLGSNDVRFIGIWGMSGIGKTTLARFIFERIQHKFEASSFLSFKEYEFEPSGFLSIKAHGLVALQEKLLCDILKLKRGGIKWDVYKGIRVTGKRLRNKRVLIVLDDVDECEQLNTLAGNHDWFGPGSRIIVTTKDKQLLATHGVRDIYTANRLNDDEALQLFSWKAFNKPYPEKNYVDLSNNFVKCAEGLPFALEVLGKSLFGKEKKIWKSKLKKLKEIPDRHIQCILQLGFDGLGDTEKRLFLDIACMFKGKDKDRVKDVLNSCSYYEVDRDLLIDNSLITISGNKLWMYDLLQEMGRRIACRESTEDRSRLWHCKDDTDLLKEKKGTDAADSIFLYIDEKKEVQLDVEAFSRMKRLRLLKIDNVIVPQDLNYLSEKFLYMEWHDYPFKSLPTSWKLDKLVELIMHRSRIEQLKKESWSSYKLKAMDLSDSENFITTPDFTSFPNLERLILQGCTMLSKVHSSIAAHQKLIILNLKDCKNLNSLPHEINSESLKTFILSGCSRLKKLPEIGRNTTRLTELYLDGTAIEELPLSFKHLTGLTLLNLRDCKNLSSFPSIICSLISSLQSFTISLSGCIGQRPKPLLLTKIVDVESKMRGACLRYEQDMTEFVENLWHENDDLCLRHDNFITYHTNRLDSERHVGEGEPSDSNPVLKTELISLLSRLYQEEWARSHWYNYIFPHDEIPNWFSSHQNLGSNVRMELPTNSHDNTRWMGLTIFASCSVHKPPAGFSDNQDSTIFLYLSSVSASDELPLAPYVAFPLSRDVFDGSDRLLVFYIPCVLFQSNRCSHIWASIESNNSDVDVEMCGIRLVYEQDVEGFVQTLAECMLRSPEAYHDSYLLNLSNQVKKCQRCDHGKDYCSFSFQRRPEPTTRSKPWFKTYLKDCCNKRDIFNYCFPQREIPKWFCHQSNGPSITIQPFFYNNPDWMAFAFYAIYSFHKHPFTIRKDLDSRIPHRFSCKFETNFGSRVLNHIMSEDEVLISLNQSAFIWVSFIPCEVLPLIRSQWEWVTFLFQSDSPDLLPVNCGVNFVRKGDIDEFAGAILECLPSYVDYMDEDEVRSSCDEVILKKLPLYGNIMSGIDSSYE